MTFHRSILFFMGLLFQVHAFGQLYEGEAAKEILPIAQSIQLEKESSLPSFLVFEEAEQLSLQEFEEWEKQTFQYESGLTFKTRKTVNRKGGMTHVFRDQYYHGIPIEHALSVVHYQAGKVQYINGSLHAAVEVGTTPLILEEVAAQTALAEVGITANEWRRVLDQHQLTSTEDANLRPDRLENTLVIYPYKGNYFLAWKSHLISPQLNTYQYVYTDAQTGKVIQVQAATLNCNIGTALTTYRGSQTILTDEVGSTFRLINDCGPADISTRFGGSTISDSDNVWDSDNHINRGGRTAHFGVTKTFDYFNSTHGQIGLDGTGTVDVRVLPSTFNAFYVPGTLELRFGLGFSDAQENDDLTAPDICGHEFTHGVFYNTGGVTDLDNYEALSIHEGIADIFGNEVEAFVDGAAPEWSIGEEVASVGARFLDNPNADVHPDGSTGSPDTYLGNFWSGLVPQHDGGVMRFWYYLLSEGGTGVNDNGTPYQVTGMGRTTAATILYEAIVAGNFGSSPNYNTARSATRQAAINLYGPCSLELKEVLAAWQAVGIGNTGSPDLSISGLQVTQANPIPLGASFPVSYNMYVNPYVYGEDQTHVSFFIKSYCQTSGLSSPTSIQLEPITCGTSSSNSTSLTMPTNISAGQYYLIAKTDHYNGVTESNETNNVACTLIEVVDNSLLPDFTPRWPSVNPSSVLPGGNLTTWVNLLNQGNAFGDYTFLCYYLSTNTTYSSDDVYLGGSFMNGLNASSSASASSNMTLPSGTAPGNYYIIFRADCYSWRQELNENNNTTYQAITVAATSGTPDLVIQNVNPSPGMGSPPFVAIGESIAVQYELANLNSGSSPGPTSTRVYLSSDETVSPDDLLVLTSIGLPPGNHTAFFSIPSNAQSQYYRVLLVADYFNVVSETNESNNVGIGHLLVLSGLASDQGNQVTQERSDVAEESLANSLEETPLKVFPNPTSGPFTLSYPVQDEPVVIQLFNGLGQQVGSHLLPANAQDGQWRYDGEQLPTGVYYLRWQSKHRQELLKLVID